MKTLGIIPARGGSKGLPGKNILQIGGLPLVCWTINAARNSSLLTDFIVSTDDEEIRKIAQHNGCRVPFLRPKELASDNSTSVDVVLHCLEFFEKQGIVYDNVILLEPTSPLRKKSEIDNALRLFFDNYGKFDGIVSVGKIHLENPTIVKFIKNDFLFPLKISGVEGNINRRQDYPDFYFPYGVLYIIKSEIIKSLKSFYTDKMMPYYIERWQNYELDDIYDFHAIESILKLKIKEGVI
jgi:CMP-N,N'-diacetyllegionaminic acid synthase